VDGGGLVWFQADPLGRLTRTFFDADGNAIKVAQADGSTWQATYGTLRQPLTITDPNGNTITRSYDTHGNLLQVTDPLGNSLTYTWTTDGRMATATDANGNTVTYGYDTQGRLISEEDAAAHTILHEYDTAGNRTVTKDELGHMVSRTFDSMGRVLSIIDATGGTTTFDYNATGNLVSTSDPVGNTWTYSYDSVGRQTGVTDELGNSTITAYDDAGRVVQRTDRNGRVVTYAYDSVGRRTSEVWLDGLGNPIATFSWTYDVAGQLLAAVDPWSQYAYTYDLLGRVATEDNDGTPGAPQVVLAYGYDAAGNLTSVTDNLGGVVSYGYDAANRLTSAGLTVSGLAGAQVEQSYDAAGRLTGQTRTVGGTGPSVSTVYGYDTANQLTSISHTSSEVGALSSFSYLYDGGGRITQTTGPEGTLLYTYDDDGQLSGVSGASSASFTYDANGNRTLAGHVTGADNRLLSDGTYNYTYDNEGNVLTKTRISDGEVTTYTWDSRNRLAEVEVRSAGGLLLHEERYTYDGKGRRIGVWSDGTQTWTAYRGDNAWADLSGSGSLTTRYLYGLQMDSLLARQDTGGNAAWYLTDNIHSIRQIVTATGAVLYAANYAAFGKVLSATGSGGDRFGFTGREFSGLTEDYFYRARYYNPETGRFLSQDPTLFTAGDPNLYRYANNNPVVLTDPTGLWSWWGALGGAVAGVVVIAIMTTPVGWVGAAVIIGGCAISGGIMGSIPKAMGGGPVSQFLFGYGTAFLFRGAPIWLWNAIRAV
jgi:RHS repeat-associated protein